MKYNYVYQRSGAPLLSWKHGPPNQSRGADARSLGALGSLSDPTIALPLPRPGSPEPVGGLGGCACHGKKPMGDIGSQLNSIPLWALALGGYFLFWKLKKK